MERIAPLLVLLAACTPGAADDSGDTDPLDTGPDPLDTDPIDTGDTATFEFFEPEVWWVEGGFGWDAQTAQIRDYGVPTQAGETRHAPWLAVYLARQAWFAGRDPSDVCWVFLQLGATPWAGTSDDDVWVGGTASTYVGSTCDDEAHPMRSDLWGDLPALTIAGKGWQQGVGPLDVAVDAVLQGRSDYAELQPGYLGGRVASSALGAHDAGGYALGWQVDPVTFTMTEAQGDPVLLPASSASASAVPTGAWLFEAAIPRTDPDVLRP